MNNHQTSFCIFKNIPTTILYHLINIKPAKSKNQPGKPGTKNI